MKVFPRGKGGGSGPVDYTTNEDDRSVKPEVLKGEPEQTKRLIDSIDNKWKYTSGVNSWAPGEVVTPEQEQQFIKEFEAVAFAGLEQDQYDCLWVRHQHADHHELHFIIPRVELESGKAFNAFAPGWQKHFDPLRDKWNIENGWSRPDDPELRRTHQPGPSHLQGDKEEIRAVVTDYLMAEIEAGHVVDRATLKASLTEAGVEIAKEGKSYVTIKDEEGQRHRLKGGIYEADWTLEQHLENAQEQSATDANRDRENPASRVAELERELESICKKRAEYNQSRYSKPEPEHRAELDNKHEADQPRDPQFTAEAPNVAASPPSMPDYMQQRCGDDYISKLVDSEPPSREASSYNDNERNAENGSGRGDQDIQRSGRNVHQSCPGPRIQNWVQKRQSSDSKNRDELSKKDIQNDELREAVEQSNRDIAERSQQSNAAASAASKQLDRASKQLDRASKQLDRASKQLDRALQQPQQHLEQGMSAAMDSELDKMKQINIADYATSKGYTLNKLKSSQHSLCYDHSNGDRLLIGQDPKSGHSVYCSVRDDQDNGSIVDFVQKRQGLNLGQIRRELRPWIGAPSQRPEYTPQPQPKPVQKDRLQVQRGLATCDRVTQHKYLESRGIEQSTLKHFNSRVFADQRGNAIFPHYDSDGVCGLEIKNEKFTGFSKSGEKGLWFAGPKEPERIVVCESAIDCISHYQLKPSKTTMYVSTGGKMSPAAKQSLETLLENNKDTEIVAAFDNDKAGREYAQNLCDMAEHEIKVDKPELKDWNEQLQHQVQEREHEMQGPQMSM